MAAATPITAQSQDMDSNETQNSSPPVVSVIIPSYNCLQYLPDTVPSVLDQGVRDMELIIVNDGSTDGTDEWLDDLAARDSRVVPIHLGGVGVARGRNTAIDKARGEWVAFLDADDFWFDGKFPAQLAFHQANPDVTLSFTNYVHVNPEGDDLGDCYGYWPRFNRIAEPGNGFHRLDNGLARIFSENVVGTSTVMARKDALKQVGGFDESLKNAEDWDLWLKLAGAGGVGYSSKVYMRYLMRPGSETSKLDLRLEYMQKIFDRHCDAVQAVEAAAVDQALARMETGWAEYRRSQGRKKDAFAHHFKAWRLAPSLRAFKSMVKDFLSMLKP